MRKLGLFGIFLLVLVGIGILSEPASARPPCSCTGCAALPNMSCISWEDGGVLQPCSTYVYFWCDSLTASTSNKAAVNKPAPFPLELLGTVTLDEGRPTPLLPVGKPGC